MQIALVSGLTGTVRNLKGRELRQLADPAMLRSGGAIELMLRSCFEGVTAGGPYPWLQLGAAPDWDRVLLGDRFDALLQIRAATFGKDYEFKVHCGNELCKEPYDWEVQPEDLPRKTLPEHVAESLMKGVNRFETRAPDGRLAVFRLLLGADEKAADKLRKQQGGKWGAHDAILMQLLALDGIAKEDTEDGTSISGKARRDVIEYLDELTWPDVTGFLASLNEFDCGIETKIETQCTHCRWIQEIQLPFGADFFRSGKKKAREALPSTSSQMKTKAPAPIDSAPSDAKA